MVWIILIFVCCWLGIAAYCAWQQWYDGVKQRHQEELNAAIAERDEKLRKQRSGYELELERVRDAASKIADRVAHVNLSPSNRQSYQLYLQLDARAFHRADQAQKQLLARCLADRVYAELLHSRFVSPPQSEPYEQYRAEQERQQIELQNGLNMPAHLVNPDESRTNYGSR